MTRKATDDVTIRLTQSQVAQVRAGKGLEGLAEEVSASLSDATKHIGDLIASASHDRKISSSLLRGLYILAALPSDGSAVGLVHFARSIGMNPSTAHRYLTTLVAAGLAEHDSGKQSYRRIPPSDPPSA
jgi:DNA-binding MarR family transcriptional regulator